MKKIALLLTTFLFIMACASAQLGRTFDTAKTQEIEIGKTTEAQVISTLGQPIRTKITSNGEKAFLYFHGSAKAHIFGNPDVASQRFAILFDKNGIVKAIDKIGIE